MEKKYRIFAINPGSTSTKIALFENDKELFSSNVVHDAGKNSISHICSIIVEHDIGSLHQAGSVHRIFRCKDPCAGIGESITARP